MVALDVEHVVEGFGLWSMGFDSEILMVAIVGV